MVVVLLVYCCVLLTALFGVSVAHYLLHLSLARGYGEVERRLDRLALLSRDGVLQKR